MDFSDDIPQGRDTSMPPSSMPDPSEPHENTRRAASALNLDDDQPNEEETSQKKKTRRPRPQNPNEVPLVRDNLGESVEGSFATFLET